jgi:hypothetical protein
LRVPNRYILYQGSSLAAIGRTALSAALQRLRGRPAGDRPVDVPGPELQRTVRPLPRRLVDDYLRHVGGDPASYRGVLPPHLFPQWALGLGGEALRGLPYPLQRALNAGCRVEVSAPLPDDEPLEVSAQLVGVDDDGRRALLRTRVTTSTRSAPGALTAVLVAIVPLARESDGSAGRRERPRVPVEAREVAFWRLTARAGLDFAKLTGDFNPVHWLPPYARALGFKDVILHGFATLARAWEGLDRGRFAGASPIGAIEVRFTRPLVLPARVGLYVDERGGVWVGDAPGGPAYVAGTFELAGEAAGSEA